MRTGKWSVVLLGVAAWLAQGLACRCDAGPARGKKKTRPAPTRKATPPPLHMTRAVVCDSIDGFEKYKILRGAALTSEEKLLVYYRPLGFRSDSSDGTYQARFSQDGQVRRQGDAKILREKIKLLEYSSPRMDFPPKAIYFKNAVSLKGLDPGKYEYIIILYDKVAQGPPARQVVKFEIVPPQSAGPGGAAADAAGPGAAPGDAAADPGR